jgi:nucleoid-associated protein YgaU
MGKNAQWTHKNDLGENVPNLIFGGGKAASMKLDLLFDTTIAEGLLSTQKDVRELYKELTAMLLIKPPENKDGKGEPCMVVVQWGDYIGFVAVLSSICEKFTYFHHSGKPLRAEVSVTLREAWNEKKKGGLNPTSRTDVRQTWVVEKGQRLDWIANEVYGRSSAWRHIAETNGLLNPTALRPGQILKIVPLS